MTRANIAAACSLARDEGGGAPGGITGGLRLEEVKKDFDRGQRVPGPGHFASNRTFKAFLPKIAASYAGTFLLAASFLAVGMLASSFTENQVVALVTRFGFSDQFGTTWI